MPDAGMPDLADLADLEARLAALGRVVVAFSGGADSALVLKVAADELPGRVVAHEFKLRVLGFGVVNGAVDLRRRQLPPRFQFGRVERYDRLAGTQFVTFLREDFFDSAAAARSDVDFVHFNRAGNSVVLAMASRKKSERDQNRRGKCFRNREPGQGRK